MVTRPGEEESEPEEDEAEAPNVAQSEKTDADVEVHYLMLEPRIFS